ncbi:MAG: ASKHA domain-containing protein [Candidatus Verstraetearchaeota archaeon]|nr:ASKHA domain-containing protein [Candidatus Verstraetearchaeota archaeon]
MEFEVVFLPEGKRCRVPEKTTLMSAALKGEVDLAAICGGKGYCGKCLVEVIDGKVSPLTDHEKKRVPKEKMDRNYRLACQTYIEGDVTIRVPDQSRVGKQRLVIMGKEPPVQIMSNIEKVYLELYAPSLEDPTADDERLLAGLSSRGYSNLTIDTTVSREMPRILREAGWKVTAVILGRKEVIAIENGDTTSRKYGLAVDIGTTKLAVFIVDLNDGTIVYADGTMNPQIKFGEDVISRINYASQGKEHREEIRSTIVEGINNLLDAGVAESEMSRDEVYEAVLVGNTAMHHLFAGIEVKSLGLAPYAAGVGRSSDSKARDTGIEINPAGNVHLLPNVAGFVGADAIADILASRLHEKERLTLLMDVGTNTEVMLGDRKGIWACSTASGPAFEGAHIRCGMRAASGAIEKVWIDSDFRASYKTIDDKKPRGICGSGIIDAVAEMLRAGLIDTSGRIQQAGSGVREGESGREFVLVPKEETETGKEDIVITQDDIREIQKAKAAIYAGFMTLVRKGGLDRGALAEIIIAGAFGNYIDPKNARIIGMIPELPLEKISFTGNTAGSGARLCLKSINARREAQIVASKVKYIELAAQPIFEEEYINAMYMPNSQLEDFPETMEEVKAPRVVRRYVRR